MYLTPPRTALAGTEFARQADQAVELAHRLTDLAQVTRGLRWLTADRLRGPGAEALTSALARVEAIRRRCLDSVHSDLLASQHGRAHAADRTRDLLALLDEATLDLLRDGGVLDESHAGGGVGDLIAPALTLFRDRDLPRDLPESCHHCRGRLRATTLREPVSRTTRTRTTCSACGVLSDTTLDQFRITHTAGHTPGSDAVFTLHHTGSATTALFQVRDKTRPTATPLHTIDATPGAHLRFPLPPDAGRDIWTARVVAVSAGSLHYARCVFAITPPGN